MTYTYIWKGESHANASPEYMKELGMTEDAIESVLAQKAYEESQNITKRQNAYKNESDPLYIEWQFELESGGVNAGEYKALWIDKVVEIKRRFPLQKTQK